MKTKYIFYLLGFFATIKGVLVFLGVDLPRRDGTIIENSIEYGERAVLFGLFIILSTFLITKVTKK